MKLNIFHINDTHSNFDPSILKLTVPIQNELIEFWVDCGGFSYINSEKKRRKKDSLDNNLPFFFFDGGDTFQGSLYFSYFKGKANADLYNILSPDGMALGNHELDLGNELFYEFLDEIKFPIFAGNWDLSKESPSKLSSKINKDHLIDYNVKEQIASYKIYNVNNVKLAVFGITIDNMAEIASPDHDTEFLKAIPVIQSTVEHLHKLKIRHIILLSHLGFRKDREVAEKVDGISIIIGGHTHTLLGNFSNVGLKKIEEYPFVMNNTLIVQSGSNSLSYGYLELTLNSDGVVSSYNGNNYLMLDTQFYNDKDKKKLINSPLSKKIFSYLKRQDGVIFANKDKSIENCLNANYRQIKAKLEKKIIAQVEEDLNHIRIPNDNKSSCVAPLVADSFLWSANKLGKNADFAIHNAGGVRSHIPKGNLSEGDISGKILPFEIELVQYKLSGEKIIKLLKDSITNALYAKNSSGGSYPYAAGLRFDVKIHQSGQVDVFNVKIKTNNGWAKIIDDREYVSISSSYTATGKEGYDEILSSTIPITPIGICMNDAFIKYSEFRKILNKNLL